jgi:Holliday junction DNA helicase RuvA
MIALITGKLVKKSPDFIILDAHGVGYRVYAPLSTYCSLPDLGETVSLHIHTHVREDAFKLYGFLTTREQFLFERLITVSKIGPKLALNILSGIPAQELEAAILHSDTQRLGTIPGVGKKTAERLVIELKDKIKSSLPPMASARPGVPWKGDNDPMADAISALTNLGFHREKAERAIAEAWPLKKDGEWSVEQLIKECLKILV